MEPFALLNLLKTLLPNLENTPENNPERRPENCPDCDRGNAERKAPPAAEQNAEAAPRSPTPNAFLDFMEKHETRARQIKKK